MEIAAGSAIFVVWLSYADLWDHYAHTRPRLAQPDQGRVYALNTHGLIVYLTKDEQCRLDLLQWTGITLFVFCIVDFRLQQKHQGDKTKG